MKSFLKILKIKQISKESNKKISFHDPHELAAFPRFVNTGRSLNELTCFNQ